MHFNEMYNVADPPDLPLEDVLKINPNSRVVRWQPGHADGVLESRLPIAAYLIEKITGEKYEDRIAEKIFKPVGMPTSSFVLTKDDEAILAKGYRDRTGPPVPYSQILFAAVRQSPHLGAGAWPMGAPAPELGRDGNRSRDRSRISQQHGAPAHDRGVVCGTAHWLRQRHRELAGRRLSDARAWRRHRRFLSLYGYSTSRDAGYVILLNSTHSPEAMRRIAKLAVRYLKADVEPPPKPKATVAAATLRKLRGLLSRRQPAQSGVRVRRVADVGRRVTVSGDHLEVDAGVRQAVTLIPVGDALFRSEDDVDASTVFADNDAGLMVMAGPSRYAERYSRWRIESVRWPVIVSAVLVLTPLVMIRRLDRPREGSGTLRILVPEDLPVAVRESRWCCRSSAS
jgi:hypothetical protein